MENAPFSDFLHPLDDLAALFFLLHHLLDPAGQPLQHFLPFSLVSRIGQQGGDQRPPGRPPGGLVGLIPLGQEMTMGLRVPPKWEAIS